MSELDILDIAVTHIANDDYNHIPEATLRERLAAIRQTRMETRLWEASDVFVGEVRDALSGWDPADPEYGPLDLDAGQDDGLETHPGINA